MEESEDYLSFTKTIVDILRQMSCQKVQHRPHQQVGHFLGGNLEHRSFVMAIGVAEPAYEVNEQVEIQTYTKFVQVGIFCVFFVSFSAIFQLLPRR